MNTTTYLQETASPYAQTGMHDHNFTDVSTSQSLANRETSVTELELTMFGVRVGHNSTYSTDHSGQGCCW